MEQQLATKCTDYASRVTDAQLKNTLTNFANQHQQHYNSLLAQLSKQGGKYYADETEYD